MDKPKQAEVVTIKEAIEQVKNWIVEKNFEKAKQGCNEILAVEKNNTEVKDLLDQANHGLENKEKPTESIPPQTPALESQPTPTFTPDIHPDAVKKEETVAKISEVIPQEPKTEPVDETPKEETPETIMANKEPLQKPATSTKETPKPATKKHFPLGKIILIIILLAIIGGLVFAFIEGWINPAFDWILNLLGL